MITHFLPTNEIAVEHPEVTFLIPACNEEITIGEFVDWCKQGLETANVSGQILIVDSSTDQTKEIALEHGAEVLSVPRLGLGRAYLDAIPYVRGKLVIMGDADLTYDTRHIKSFLEKFSDGFEFIMGSRFKGKIERGAMPFLHQYFGTPVTTWILNLMYGCRFSDIHCGMRAITLSALKRLRLQSQGWQYASEMIIKAIHLDLKHTEVPVIFHKDRDGRQSHHKRVGWYAPWVAGWMNLKAMFTFGADFFLYKIGMVMAGIGFLGTALLFKGPINLAGIGFSLHWMLFFLILFISGMQFTAMGLLATTIYDIEMKRTEKNKKIFHLNWAIPFSFVCICLGIACILPLLNQYLKMHFKLGLLVESTSYYAVGGLGLCLFGIIYFTSALLFNAVIFYHGRKELPSVRTQ